MLIGEILQVAIAAIWANKLRSFLTMLGIIIGIAAVITMVSLGEGAQRHVQSRLQSLGTNILTVRPGQQFFGGLDRGDNEITAKNAEALRIQPRFISAVSPRWAGASGQLRRRQLATKSDHGVWPGTSSCRIKGREGPALHRRRERGRRRWR
jgi:putative ABC transport system permease protein